LRLHFVLFLVGTAAGPRLGRACATLLPRLPRAHLLPRTRAAPQLPACLPFTPPLHTTTTRPFTCHIPHVRYPHHTLCPAWTDGTFRLYGLRYPGTSYPPLDSRSDAVNRDGCVWIPTTLLFVVNDDSLLFSRFGLPGRATRTPGSVSLRRWRHAAVSVAATPDHCSHLPVKFCAAFPACFFRLIPVLFISGL